MSRPVLYSGTKNASSWAMRAWLALRASGYEFEEQVVDIRRPQRFANLAKIASFSPPGCVPVLDTGTTVIYDSLAIMEFANDVSEARLLPRSLESRAHARSLLSWHHSGLSSICARISFESSFYPMKRPLSVDEQAQASRLLSVYESCLHRYGGPYLFGDLSLVEYMHAPTIIRLFRHRVNTSEHPQTKAWFTRVLEDSHLQAWLKEADALPPIWYDDDLLPEDPSGTLLRDGNV